MTVASFPRLLLLGEDDDDGKVWYDFLSFVFFGSFSLFTRAIKKALLTAARFYLAHIYIYVLTLVFATLTLPQTKKTGV